MILVSFIEGNQLPFSRTKSDVFLRIKPHQFSLPDGAMAVKKTTKMGWKEKRVDCICVQKGTQASTSFDDVMSEMIKKRRSLLWLTPTLIPTECLASIFTNWLNNAKPTANLGLGVVIPSTENPEAKKDHYRAWSPTSSGTLKKNEEEIDLPVWYPSLAREPCLLQKIADVIKPFDIFPLVEFPQIIDYTTEREIALHFSMLDQYRTRTRNLIYLNNKSPAEALKTLFGSFEAIPRSGKMPRTLVITPGGKSVSYLVTLLAGVFAGGIFITPERENPYSKALETWGFAIFKKCD